VADSLFHAFAADREPTTDDMRQALCSLFSASCSSSESSASDNQHKCRFEPEHPVSFLTAFAPRVAERRLTTIDSRLPGEYYHRITGEKKHARFMAG